MATGSRQLEVGSRILDIRKETASHVAVPWPSRDRTTPSASERREGLGGFPNEAHPTRHLPAGYGQSV